MNAAELNRTLRRAALAAALAAGVAAPLLLTSLPASAESRAYDAAAFKAAQAAGKPILVEVTAPWCPVCARQKPILAALEAKSEFKNLAVFTVDFDTQKELLRAMNVQKQSTLITFKGSKETGRTTGETDPAAIEAQLQAAIKA